MGGERHGNAINRRFDRAKDSVIENAVGKQDSWAKKVRTGQAGVMLEDLPKLLDALGLKVVDKAKVCINRDVHEAYRTLAKYAAFVDGGPKLEQDFDDE
jgi:hypothetical protein